VLWFENVFAKIAFSLFCDWTARFSQIWIKALHSFEEKRHFFAENDRILWSQHGPLVFIRFYLYFRFLFKKWKW
jgi:hypothetical protein